MLKFSHIGQLHNVVQTVDARRAAGVDIERVRYSGSVKLHGSNAAVVAHPDGLRAQSRNREITPDDDNLGFAAFVLGDPQRRAAIAQLADELREAVALEADRPLALFGEWVGPGVQSRVGVNQLSARQWVLFAIATREPEQERTRYFELPSLGERLANHGVYSIADGPRIELELDFSSRVALGHAASRIDEATASIDERCPWAARFGVEGVGEGLVWQPVGEHFGDSELVFKSKGKRHQVTARGPRTPLDPALLANVEAFVAYAVTQPRLAQGLDVLRELGKPVEMRSLGPFLAWFAGDIRRECAAELERSELTWKQVVRPINEAAKAWFIERL
jgi:hypothetical protein